MRLYNIVAATALVAALGIPTYAQAPLTFSGGSGNPLTVTLTAPVTYTITDNSSATVFNFQGVGDLFHDAFPSVTGTMTYSINNGTPQTMDFLNSGRWAGSISGEDIYSYCSSAVTSGDIVTLLPGYLTTNDAIADLAPANGNFSTFISNDPGNINSTFGQSGVTAPEPGTLALLLACGAFIARRRKRNEN